MLSYQERITIHKIYTCNTFHDYQKHACYFDKWCKERYGCRMFSECRQYVDKWIMERSILAPHSQKLEACALVKVFNCTIEDLIKTAVRHRKGLLFICTQCCTHEIYDSTCIFIKHTTYLDCFLPPFILKPLF
jgi:hypothetical protein